MIEVYRTRAHNCSLPFMKISFAPSKRENLLRGTTQFLKKIPIAGLIAVSPAAQANTCEGFYFDDVVTEENVAACLETGIDITDDNLISRFAIDKAVIQGNVAVLKMLLEAGLDPNSGVEIPMRSGETMTANLIFSSFEGGKEVMELLIEAGADVEVRSFLGHTPLQLAASFGDLEAVAVLVGAGAKLEAKDEDGMTALLWALRGRHSKVALYLISVGADVNSRSRNGTTPLQLAVGDMNPMMVEALVAAGAEFNQRTESGEKLLETAERSGNMAVVEILRRATMDQ